MHVQGVSGEKALAIAVLEHASRDVEVVCGNHAASTLQPGVPADRFDIEAEKAGLIEFFSNGEYFFWCDILDVPEYAQIEVAQEQLLKLRGMYVQTQ